MAEQKSSGNDFLLEYRLRELNPDLHKRFRDTVFAMQYTLSQFTRLFPQFTDHSVFHSLKVIEFCNELIGPEQLDRMNASELYVLLMSAYLHDAGMSISEKDYEEFKDALGADEYFASVPDAEITRFVRDYHHEFSGLFIQKYADLLEIPSAEALFAVKQVSRGHRRTDLYDEEEYPAAYRMPNGDTVCLPYLAALIRLADEIDVVADRNPKLLYDLEAITDEKEIIYHKVLAAVPRMDILPEGFLVYVETDEPVVELFLENLIDKMQETLNYCRSVTANRTPFRITQEWVRMQR